MKLPKLRRLSVLLPTKKRPEIRDTELRLQFDETSETLSRLAKAIKTTNNEMIATAARLQESYGRNDS